ncbi:ComEC/Rec2 family competence protein [Pseudomonas sp. CGJS7]|uniref:ComEC/Rec2 family competence protein n=1 Tax=Pseudomonas sp. CGJS7 TaxID=3109348 RepID=UPI00300BE195
MPKPFLNIEMLPARHGDCLWIEYGTGADTGRVLIDGGPVDTYPRIQSRIAAMPAGDTVFELIVLSHVDADHVEGLVRLFADKPLPFLVREVWFNGWRQMERAQTLGAMQAEFLSALLVERVPKAWDPDAEPWVVPDQGALPKRTLPGGLELTLLSPSVKSLRRMAAQWKTKVKKFSPGDLNAAWEVLAGQKKFLPKQGLLGGSSKLDQLLSEQFLKDGAAPNGSSIALLAEYRGKSALLLADAHPDVVCASLRRLCAERGVERIEVDAVKVAHHGSKGNTSVALLELIRSPSYLISSNGDQFEHPDAACIARIIKHGQPEHLHFNYKSEFTRPWLLAAAQKRYGYRAHVRADAQVSLKIEL